MKMKNIANGKYYLLQLEGFNASGYCIAKFNYNNGSPFFQEEQTLTDLSKFKITSVTKL